MSGGIGGDAAEDGTKFEQQSALGVAGQFGIAAASGPGVVEVALGHGTNPVRYGRFAQAYPPGDDGVGIFLVAQEQYFLVVFIALIVETL